MARLRPITAAGRLGEPYTDIMWFQLWKEHFARDLSSIPIKFTYFFN